MCIIKYYCYLHHDNNNLVLKLHINNNCICHDYYHAI